MEGQIVGDVGSIGSRPLHRHRNKADRWILRCIEPVGTLQLAVENAVGGRYRSGRNADLELAGGNIFWIDAQVAADTGKAAIPVGESNTRHGELHPGKHRFDSLAASDDRSRIRVRRRDGCRTRGVDHQETSG